VEEWLLQNEKDKLGADILITGRHVDGQPGSSSFLEAVSPRLVISSSVDFPRVQKIPRTWETLLREKGIPLLRQDQSGAVSIFWKNGKPVARAFLDRKEEFAIRESVEIPPH
jgi:beta-lactamase superfamily II metal-dependent hydrolase